MGTFDQLRGRLGSVAGPQLPGTSQGKRAAVLALFSDTDAPDLLFTRRSLTLRNHPGQMAFPGGRIEAGESPADAALREAHEEIGLDPSRVTVLRCLPYAVASGFRGLPPS